MKICPRLFCTIAALCAFVFAQANLPFGKYPVSSTFKGTPAPAQPVSKTAHRFRTVISDGAKKGPNFAGHYTIVTWGCGTACAQFAIVDAISGRVFDTPFSGVSFESEQGEFFQQSGIQYQLNSSLLVIQGCPDEKDCAQHLYNWKNDRLQEVGTEPLMPIGEQPKR
jgi:hypothetical protein